MSFPLFTYNIFNYYQGSAYLAKERMDFGDISDRDSGLSSVEEWFFLLKERMFTWVFVGSCTEKNDQWCEAKQFHDPNIPIRIDRHCSNNKILYVGTHNWISKIVSLALSALT